MNVLIYTLSTLNTKMGSLCFKKQCQGQREYGSDTQVPTEKVLTYEFSKHVFPAIFLKPLDVRCNFFKEK